MKLKRKIKPQFLIIISFLCVILAGTLCLLLPISTTNRKGLSFLDALFLSTSSTCVTGLSTIAVGPTLSTFGHLIVLILIEIGGLSFLTLVSFIYSLVGAKIIEPMAFFIFKLFIIGRPNAAVFPVPV